MPDTRRKFSTQSLVMCAILTAFVIVLQLMGSFVRFGPFAVTLVLVPIVIGAALCGMWAGAWLGLVFGAVVLITDSAAFMAVSIIGTIVTVLAKGILAGAAAAAAYHLASRYSGGTCLPDCQYRCVSYRMQIILFRNARRMGCGGRFCICR